MTVRELIMALRKIANSNALVVVDCGGVCIISQVESGLPDIVHIVAKRAGNLLPPEKLPPIMDIDSDVAD